MVSSYSAGQYQSVVFFDNGQADREMLYGEFNSVLDNLVPMTSYANKTMQAVLIGINGQIKITSAVFFLIGFDSAGIADRKWNIPLDQLAEQATQGPNLGAGSIKLCCRSQCPVDWHVKDLWDPDMNRAPNDFVVLRDLVHKNRLGFKVDDDAGDKNAGDKNIGAPTGVSVSVGDVFAALSEASEADKALAQMLIELIRKTVSPEDQEQTQRNQQLLLAAQKTRFDDALNEQALQHSDEMREMQAHFARLQGLLEQERVAAESLRLQLHDQQQQIDKMRESLQGEVSQNKSDEKQKAQLLQAHLDAEIAIRIQASAAEFQQKLAKKEAEVSQMQAQQTQLNEEIKRLREEQIGLISGAGEQFLARLRDNRVSFLAYHQGAGNVKMDIASISVYLENPMAYVAEICKISEADYRTWLTHYNNPICSAHSSAKQGVCGKKLKRIEMPEQFIVGRSNRCPLHWDLVDDAALAQSPSQAA